jgi:hypothetical protein
MSQLDEGQADVVAADLPAQDESTATAPVVSEEDRNPELDELYPDDERPSGDETEEVDEPGGDDPDPDVNDDLDPIAAPNSWKAEEKEFFAKLPREVQETLSRREVERERFVQQKAQEAGQAQQRAESAAQGRIAELHAEQARKYTELAASFLPEPPDPNLLWSQDPNDHLVYQQQAALYQSAAAQQQQLQQSAEAESQKAQQAAQTQAAWEQFNEHRRLHQQRPDWFDDAEPTQFLPDGTAIPPKLKPEIVSRLQPIGEALGYSGETMANANANDFLALDTAAQWKAKADKWDEHQKRKMEGVRQAKTLPKIAKPGVGGQRVQTEDPIKLLYPND